MATLDDALVWLNQFDTVATHINTADGKRLKTIAETQPMDLQMTAEFEALLNTDQYSADPLERPEALLYLARGQFAGAQHWQKPEQLDTEIGDEEPTDRAQLYQEARENIADALTLYDADDHRRAVVLFMLGMIEWQDNNHYLAYIHWDKARRLFEKLQKQYQLAKQTLESAWYCERQLDVMSALYGTPEEAYTWLNWFPDEAKLIAGPALDLQDMILSRFSSFEVAGVHQMVKDLHNLGMRTPDYKARGEIFVFCGMAMYKLGKFRESIQFQNRAVMLFDRGSHRQAVAVWMLGIAAWHVPAERNTAMRNWQQAMEIFEELSRQAVLQNWCTKMEWYSATKDIMGKALNQRVRESYPSS